VLYCLVIGVKTPEINHTSTKYRYNLIWVVDNRDLEMLSAPGILFPSLVVVFKAEEETEEKGSEWEKVKKEQAREPFDGGDSGQDIAAPHSEAWAQAKAGAGAGKKRSRDSDDEDTEEEHDKFKIKTPGSRGKKAAKLESLEENSSDFKAEEAYFDSEEA